jgi:hypothetical protein
MTALQVPLWLQAVGMVRLWLGWLGCQEAGDVVRLCKLAEMVAAVNAACLLVVLACTVLCV